MSDYELCFTCGGFGEVSVDTSENPGADPFRICWGCDGKGMHRAAPVPPPSESDNKRIMDAAVKALERGFGNGKGIRLK